MWPVLILLALIALLVGASALLWWYRRQSLPLGSPTPAEAEIHLASQRDRIKLVKASTEQIKAVEAMDHEGLRNALNHRDTGNN